ncbi:hypothetical protein ND748_06380 [Frankia sp. AiPs1]|nr:hypothetical protein [Frankia sp. AiPs1]
MVAAPVRDVAETVAPSARDADAIDRAVRASEYTAQVPAKDYEVAGTLLASSDPSWAYTELHPTVADLDRAEGVLHRTDGGWKLVQLGTYEVGCGVAPTAVLDDFGLECPPADATDPAATDPAGTSPAATDSAATDPAATDPAGTSPAATDSAAADSASPA